MLDANDDDSQPNQYKNPIQKQINLIQAQRTKKLTYSATTMQQDQGHQKRTLLLMKIGLLLTMHI